MEEYLASIFFWWRALSRDFLGALLETLGIFFGFNFWFPFDNPPHLKSGAPPRPGTGIRVRILASLKFIQGLFRNWVSCIFNSDDHL